MCHFYVALCCRMVSEHAGIEEKTLAVQNRCLEESLKLASFKLAATLITEMNEEESETVITAHSNVGDGNAWEPKVFSNLFIGKPSLVK